MKTTIHLHLIIAFLTGAPVMTNAAERLSSDSNRRPAPPAAWNLNGNAGTTPGPNFLGTTDNQALELKVNALRVLRLEPSPGPVGHGFMGPNFIGGYESNSIAPGLAGSTIGGGGGTDDGIPGPHAITGNFGTIGGGYGNRIEDANFAFIGGGAVNTLEYGSVGSVISGGEANRLRGNSYASTISGGILNSVGVLSVAGTIGGGLWNSISDGTVFGTIGGGGTNTVGGSYATVPGGAGNVANGTYSFAAGRSAIAEHLGTFVWADGSQVSGFASRNANEFAVRATGGARFVSSVDGAGVSLPPGGGGWVSLCDRNAKENFCMVSGREVLEKVATLPLTSWNYKSQDKSIRHIGPMAQDFYEAFGIGESERTIGTIDADGVSLAAIQGLNEKLEAEIRRNREKDAEILELRKAVSEMRAALEKWTQRNSGSD
jgi:hypothetical protein